MIANSRACCKNSEGLVPSAHAGDLRSRTIEAPKMLMQPKLGLVSTCERRLRLHTSTRDNSNAGRLSMDTISLQESIWNVDARYTLDEHPRKIP